VKSNNNHKK